MHIADLKAELLRRVEHVPGQPGLGARVAAHTLLDLFGQYPAPELPVADSNGDALKTESSVKPKRAKKKNLKDLWQAHR